MKDDEGQRHREGHTCQMLKVNNDLPDRRDCMACLSPVGELGAEIERLLSGPEGRENERTGGKHKVDDCVHPSSSRLKCGGKGPFTFENTVSCCSE